MFWGVQMGDIIAMVDDQSVENMKAEDVASKMSGPAGTETKITTTDGKVATLIRDVSADGPCPLLLPFLCLLLTCVRAMLTRNMSADKSLPSLPPLRCLETKSDQGRSETRALTGLSGKGH